MIRSCLKGIGGCITILCPKCYGDVDIVKVGSHLVSKHADYMGTTCDFKINALLTELRELKTALFHEHPGVEKELKLERAKNAG